MHEHQVNRSHGRQQALPLSETTHSQSAHLQPFDWITSASSLESILLPILSSTESNRILHVGCGSSILGELLVKDPKYNICTIVNVDCDVATLNRMQQRWKNTVEESLHSDVTLEENSMQFIPADFTLPNTLQHYTDEPSNLSKFDMVLDKSTLDCMLCTDTGAVGLLLETYRCLKENGGVYIVVSFHPSDFIKPLLENLPGACWDVDCTTTPRQIEQLNSNITTTHIAATHSDDKSRNDCETTSFDSTRNVFTWSSGTFQPDEHYIKNVTVAVCRRRMRPRDSTAVVDDKLDWDQVYKHVHQTNNQWYQHTNPLLTKERVQAIERGFVSQSITTEDRNNVELGLLDCYPILFTSDERENLSYEDFLDDWRSFRSTLSSDNEDTNRNIERIPADRMSFRTAIAFLHVMQ
jgi:hypothetical protein